MTDVATRPEDSAGAEHHDDHGDHNTSLGLSNMKMAMWLFLGSECLLFGALISTYLLSKTRFLTELQAGNPDVIERLLPAEQQAQLAEAGVRGGFENLPEIFREMAVQGTVEPIFDIPFTSFSSFVLLMSSLCMVLAHKATEDGDYKNQRIWLATTTLLGSVFIGGQIYEFTAFYREGLTFGGSLFGSAFYTLTGFHGAHVTGGIAMLAALLILSFRGKLKSDRAETVELVGLYWHFVDVVWVLIFTIVYLIP
jgi:cytochrome c oxidase subunit 3/cytochrome o ubiquinol oxidase subunit 3